MVVEKDRESAAELIRRYYDGLGLPGKLGSEQDTNSANLPRTSLTNG
jgi:hypothetical protein